MVILTGFIGAIPTFLFYFRKEPTRKQFFVRTILHFIIIETLIMIEGWLFRWYDEFIQGLIVFIMIFVVYLFVWFFSFKLDCSLADNINNALKKINDDEEE